eukprot:gnl/TRDRNA2_/TRDRNA2_150816_c0_seq1.p1 gnl/TRDRNA2_/TRDRNA2_150816_c0~~gnl/TRDRNA2_/TRDRNA2_150816_c0_seq1.p1  ORF type:complete len:477 (-),score=58.46 gnl/TRDRNA2_/TRDRNA2_150816_c0_seq1:188-1618(-)
MIDDARAFAVVGILTAFVVLFWLRQVMYLLLGLDGEGSWLTALLLSFLPPLVFLASRRAILSSPAPPPRIWAQPCVRQLLARCPSLLKGPQPPWWATGAMFQMGLYLGFYYFELYFGKPIPFKRFEVKLPTRPMVGKGCDDSTQESSEPLPPEVCTVDICPDLSELPASAPCVFLLPGMRGNSHDLPGLSQPRAVLAQGWRCVVMHRRGHTPGQGLTVPRWNLFGDAEDVERVVEAVRGQLGFVAPDAPIFLVGNSMGSALCFNTLRHYGPRSPFLCAFGTCPGYDVSLEPHSCLARGSALLQLVLLPAVKQFFCRKNEEVLRKFNAAAYTACMNARDIQEFFAAHMPFTGYATAADYIEAANPVRNLESLKSKDFVTPCILLNAKDDPICTENNVLEHGALLQRLVDESSDGGASVAPMGIVLTSNGSHCPFFDGPRLRCWSDVLMTELFKAALAQRKTSLESERDMKRECDKKR